MSTYDRLAQGAGPDRVTVLEPTDRLPGLIADPRGHYYDPKTRRRVFFFWTFHPETDQLQAARQGEVMMARGVRAFKAGQNDEQVERGRARARAETIG